MGSVVWALALPPVALNITRPANICVAARNNRRRWNVANELRNIIMRLRATPLYLYDGIFGNPAEMLVTD